MVEFTVEEILVAEKPLHGLSQAKLPVGVAFQLSKILKVVGEELRIVRETQLAIAEKYGKRDENGELVEEKGMYPIAPENMESFNTEMEDLLKQLVSLNVRPISAERLDGAIELTAADMMALEKFFTE